MAVSAGVLFAIFAMLSYGLADFLAKKAVDRYGPFTALKISYSFGALAILVFSLAFVKIPVITIHSIIFILLASITGTAGWLMFYKGLEKGKVSIVSPISSSWGIVPFVLAIILLSEKLRLPEVLASISIFVGIFLVSVNWKEFVTIAKKRLYTGAGLALLSLIAFGLSGFLIKFIVDEIGAFYTVVLTRIVTAVLIFIYAEKAAKPESKFEYKFIWLLIVVSLFDITGYLNFSFGLSVGLVSIVSAITSATPLLVVLLAYFFMKERLAANQYLGILLIIAGFAGLALL